MNIKKIFENKQRLLIVLAAVIALLIPVFISNSYVISILVMTLMYAALSSAWNFLSGYAGQFAFGLFFALGAYICGGLFANFNISPWIGMFIAGAVCAVIGFLIGLLTFNLNGSYYAISTIAVMNIFQLIFSQNKVILGVDFRGSSGLRIPWVGDFVSMQFLDKRAYYYIILAILVITLVISYVVSKTRPGYYFKAINTNQMAASSLGVNVMKYKQFAQFLTSFIMGVIGGFYVMYLTHIEPVSMFSFEIVFQILLFAIVGGRATVFGPVIGAVILMPIYYLLRFSIAASLPGLPTAVFGVVLILATQYLPEGLVPLLRDLSHAKAMRKKQSQLAADAASGQ
jgi:branched-chain amino acid transport system permease protein